MAGRYARRHVNLPLHVVEHIDKIVRGEIMGIPSNVMGLRGRDDFCRLAVALLAASLEIEGEGETIMDRYQRLVAMRGPTDRTGNQSSNP